MKILYLCCGYGEIDFSNVTYNDLYIKRKNGLMCDCRDIDISKYDIVVASPPCNFWSKANYRRDSSNYAQLTKPLLLYCIDLLRKYPNIPIIIENVRNLPLFMKHINLFDIYFVATGRHTYFSNRDIDFIKKFKFEKSCNISNLSRKKREGDLQVRTVFNRFIYEVLKNV